MAETMENLLARVAEAEARAKEAEAKAKEAEAKAASTAITGKNCKFRCIEVTKNSEGRCNTLLSWDGFRQGMPITITPVRAVILQELLEQPSWRQQLYTAFAKAAAGKHDRLAKSESAPQAKREPTKSQSNEEEASHLMARLRALTGK